MVATIMMVIVVIVREIFTLPRRSAKPRKIVWAEMAGGPGFEPRLTESESAVLPLNYFPKRLLVGDDITELAGEGKRIVS